MSRNGSGVYSLPTPQNPVVDDTPITTDWANTTLTDIATEITNSIDKGGRTTPTANLPMGGFKHTGLGSGSAATDSASLGQVQAQAVNWCGTAGGTANALTLTPSPAITAYAAGQVFRFKSGASANAGATTVAISGLSTIAIQVAGFACSGGEILASQWYEVVVDASLTSCQLRRIGDRDAIKGPNIASAATINCDSNGGDFAHVTGTTAITAITLSSGCEYELVFDDALTLTHNATTLILPSGASITTAAGDRAKFRGDGSGNVRCMWYTKADGTAIIGAVPATQAEMEAASISTRVATPSNVNWHPGVAKAWIKCNAAGAIQASHNITSITDNGTGDVTVTIATDFSSADYSAVVSARASGPVMTFVDSAGASQAAGSLRVLCYNTGGAATDPTNYYLACFGDQ